MRRQTTAAMAGLRRRLSPPVEGPTVAIAFNLLPDAVPGSPGGRIGEQRLLLVQYWRQMQSDIASKAGRDADDASAPVPVVDVAVVTEAATFAPAATTHDRPTRNAGGDAAWVPASVLFAKPSEPAAAASAPLKDAAPPDAVRARPSFAEILAQEAADAVAYEEPLVRPEAPTVVAHPSADADAHDSTDSRAGFELVAHSEADFPLVEASADDEDAPVERPIDHAVLPFEAAVDDPLVEPIAAVADAAMVELLVGAVDDPVIEPLVDAIVDPIVEPLVEPVEDPIVEPEPAMVIALDAASPALETAVPEPAEAPHELADESQIEDLIAELSASAFPKPDIADVPIELATDEQIDRLIAQLASVPSPAFEPVDAEVALPEPEALPEPVAAAANEFAEHAIEAAREAFVEPLVEETAALETPSEVAESVPELPMSAMPSGHLAEPEVLEAFEEPEPARIEPAVAAIEVEMPAVVAEAAFADLISADDAPEPVAEAVPELSVPAMPSGHLAEPEVLEAFEEPEASDDVVPAFEPTLDEAFLAAADLDPFGAHAGVALDGPDAIEAADVEAEVPFAPHAVAFAAPLTPEVADEADDEPAQAASGPGPAFKSDPAWTDAVAEWTRTAQERPARRADVVPLVRPKPAVRLPKGHASLPALERFLRSAQARRRHVTTESVA